MIKPCAVFWDIQNIDVPKGQTVDSIVDLIRSTVIKPYNLYEISFFCVYDAHKSPANFDHSLTNLDFLTYNGVKDSADMKIIDLMRKFVKVAGQDCTIILLSGDGDYYGTLIELKKLHDVSIHVIKLSASCSPKLDQISDYTFMLANGELKPVKATANPTYFISILNQYSVNNFNELANELNALAVGSIGNSAILCGNLICIGFPTLGNAEQAIEQLNESQFHEQSSKVEFDSQLRFK
ncbi:meiosis regulator and mRNA stability factor 1-like [Tetranychus urticae]|uniref:meiosis regulator and mRNA stability factor 1-like n=1 Tax=Tetranychus urticae TaxID=32264 RepID=UPI00077BB79E|nr:meiosis regulator and mRNA stability factor 1-like [Tetranychus urticae]